MASVLIASITSRIKGHHVYVHKYKVREEFSCFLEPGNPHSPSDNAIVVKTRVEDTDKKETGTDFRPHAKRWNSSFYRRKDNRWKARSTRRSLGAGWRNRASLQVLCLWAENIQAKSKAWTSETLINCELYWHVVYVVIVWYINKVLFL